MNYLKFFKDISKKDIGEAGGKGASLGEMTNAGIPVPPGFVVLASAFDRFLEETSLNVEIVARLKEVNVQDTNSLEKASAVIRDSIHDHAMPPDLELEIFSAYNMLGAELVAVRSSATAEDSAIASWAGELDTFLNTTVDSLIENVKRCWSSLFTPRAIFYRHEKNLIDHYVSVAVVIQKMIQSDVSGIAFTVHPVTEDRDQLIIEAGMGLGEAIVGGHITPDSYVVSKSGLNILDVQISAQAKKLVKSIGKGGIVTNEWVEVGESQGAMQKLSGQQIIDSAQVFMGVEKHYGFPCDIEWAMQGNVLFITQSRPITTLKP